MCLAPGVIFSNSSNNNSNSNTHTHPINQSIKSSIEWNIMKPITRVSERAKQNQCTCAWRLSFRSEWCVAFIVPQRSAQSRATMFFCSRWTDSRFNSAQACCHCHSLAHTSSSSVRLSVSPPFAKNWKLNYFTSNIPILILDRKERTQIRCSNKDTLIQIRFLSSCLQLGLSTPWTLWGWALQGQSGVGHSRDERGVDRARRRVEFKI